VLLAGPAAAGLALLGLAWQRVRWPAWLAGAAVIAFALPHLDLLVVPATPTVFYVSPTGFSVAAIARGAALYPDHGPACHGAGGKGDGPAAAGLPAPPADLTATHLRAHTDGEMFSWLTAGISAPDGRPAMPAFGAALPEDDRWALIDFLRARNASAALAENQFSSPVPAPALEAICPDGQTREMAGLRGQVVRVLAGAEPAPVAAPPGVTDLLLAPPGGAEPPAGACTATDPAAWVAYAVLSGVPAAALAGTQFLVDASGWLRARWRPGEAHGWSTPESLAEAVRRIRAAPIAVSPGENHVHAH
jgi:mono/diheme cytochrome c family protein